MQKQGSAISKTTYAISPVAEHLLLFLGHYKFHEDARP